ncbi:dATP/dGTP pyrophosphohydrolase domain-containing protein [Rhizobium sp. 18055]|uniref:dATP/dGTP pyrophosphohydrolase domain-containing protein n=1 Tax=Rhizobium sp. 18055 TaxID=2681403 RepID=UPI00190F47DD|nr:dATP/dGTP pyrophosphohydrolase domain-containing protein [Rhizobium sp. 18055]
MSEAIFRARLQAIIDWADLALLNRDVFDKHGARNLDGPVFDAARDALNAPRAEVPEIESGRFEQWSLEDFAGQCRMQSREMLDPEYAQFMGELAKRLRGVADRTIDTSFLADFASWNVATFGPGERTAGTIAHIRKELLEIEADPTDPKEWIDVLLLAVNGLIRIGKSPAEIIDGIRSKHAVNQARTWPDWRSHPDTPIEHVRSEVHP